MVPTHLLGRLQALWKKKCIFSAWLRKLKCLWRCKNKDVHFAMLQEMVQFYLLNLSWAVTCYCREIWGKTSRKGFVETWKWQRMPRSCKHQAACPQALMAAHPSAASCPLLVSITPWVMLRTPCFHPNSAFNILILSLPQMQLAGNTTDFIMAPRAPNRVWILVLFSSQQTKRQKAVGFFRRLIPSVQGMGKQN